MYAVNSKYKIQGLQTNNLYKVAHHLICYGMHFLKVGMTYSILLAFPREIVFTKIKVRKNSNSISAVMLHK